MKTTYDRPVPCPVELAGTRVALVQAAWHREFTDRMVSACHDILTASGVPSIDHVVVPGCYEIPLCTKKLAARGSYDAIAVFGAIVKGETDHYSVILETCIREIGRVMYEFETPIIMEILPVHSPEHLRARCEGDGNKGIEAAQAIIDTVILYRSFDARFSNVKSGPSSS